MPNKDIPTEFKRIKVPDNYEWEVHNLHAYADKKKAFERGEITLVQLREFEHQYMESEEQRAMRWRRDHVMRELDIETFDLPNILILPLKIIEIF